MWLAEVPGLGIEPELQQWQCQILSLLDHQGTPKSDPWHCPFLTLGFTFFFLLEPIEKKIRFAVTIGGGGRGGNWRKAVRHKQKAYLWAFYPVPLIISGICVCVHMRTCMYQCHTVLITVALWYNLKPGSLIPSVPFFFFNIALAIQGLLCFHTDLKILPDMWRMSLVTW